MARRAGSPIPTPLPKVSFVKVQDDYSKQPKGVHDLQTKSYGYNDSNAEFQRPEHYIRYIEPLESELAVQVEYDMDEQDQAWLDALNADRKKDQLDKVSYETFEIVMDRLEKEWFDLTKNIPKPDFALPSEDSTCAICDDSEGENTNAIVFCDGCNLAVHQDCYGVPYIPEGQWLCRKCTVFPESPVSCILCPNEGGAFKQTVHGEWVHLLCAIWVPETRVGNEVFMEPVTGIDRISKQRWKLKCDVCGIREGACIQCNKTSCFLAFHATCARKERLLMPMKASQGSEAPTLACYCEKHLPKEQADIRAVAFDAEDDSGDDETDGENAGTKSPKSSKTARAYAKTYKPGPPVVPYIIVRRILHYIGKMSIRHKDKFVLLVCKYWSLKREARRGAPLLKRLHLEPWTANSSSRTHSDEDKAIKLEFMKRLRDDLERLRVLTQTTRKREAQKLRQVETIRDVLSQIIFPHEAPLRMAFEKIMSADRHDFFKNPVSKVDVPDYYDVIKNPMCWSTIDQKLDAHEYWDLQEFKVDVGLVLTNAMTYNAKTTAFYRAAERIQSAANTILSELEEKLIQRHPELEHTSLLDDSKSTSSSSEPVLGNLEPPLSLLDLLSLEGAIHNDTDLILSSSPITSLFNYEFPNFRPPPPPPPRKPTRTEQLEAKRRQRLAALDAAPGFRAPRTRHAKAQAAAFEAEATGASPGPTSGTPPLDLQQETEAPVEVAVRRSRKGKHVLPGQSEEIPMVNDVDNQESFKLFNGGWVLPPDRKRGNRPPVERRPAPPPRKRQKTEREKSHLSAYSTSVMENETLRTSSTAPEEHDVDVYVEAEAEVPVPSPGTGEPEVPVEVLEPVQVAPSVDMMDVDQSPAESQQEAPPEPHDEKPELPEEPEPQEDISEPQEDVPESHADVPEPHHEVTEPQEDVPEPPVEALEPQEESLEQEEAPEPPEEVPEPQEEIPEPEEEAPEPEKEPESEDEVPEPPPRIIIIEELDSPVTRREKNKRRKEERLRLAAEQAAQAEAKAASQKLVAGPSQQAAQKAAQTGDTTEDDRADGTSSELSSLSDLSDGEREPEVQAPPREPGEIVLEDGRTLEGGTLVWAKLKAWPWWPAVIYEPDDPDIPIPILERRASHPRMNEGPLHLVQFYDRRRNWEWLELSKLLLLGEDEELDADMLAPNSKRQRWRNSSDRTSCRTAHREAKDEMERDDDSGTENA